MQPKATRTNKSLIIELPIERPRRSASGKTRLIASTHGRLVTNEDYEGKPIVVVASAYFYPNGAEWKKRRRIGAKDADAKQD